MRTPESIITTWSSAACGVSILALYFAIRGRRVDDHPLCRKCGFDLFNLPDTSHKCPECGRDLNRRRAKRIGHRKKRTAILTLSLLVFLASTGWLGFIGVMTARGTNWNDYKPVSWLLRETRTPGTRTEALDQFLSRLKRDKLTDDEVRQIAQAALEHQADRKQPWIIEWGKFLELAHDRKRLGDEQWRKYVEQACEQFELEVRPVVRRGQPIPFRLRMVPPRAAVGVGATPLRPEPLFHLDGQVLMNHLEMLATGEQQRIAMYLNKSVRSGLRTQQPISGLSSKQPIEGTVTLPPPSVLYYEDGDHQAGVTINVLNSFGMAPSAPPIQIRLLRPLKLVTDVRPTVQLIYDNDKAPAVEGALTATATVSPVANEIVVTVVSSGAPVDLAFSGWLRDGEIQRDLGDLLFPAGKADKHVVTMPYVPSLWNPKSVEIVLTPRPELAEKTVDVTSVWAGQIGWYSVPVKGGEPGESAPAKAH